MNSIQVRLLARRLAFLSVLLLLGAAAAAHKPWRAQPPAALDADAIALRFCAPVAAEAQVQSGAKADRTMRLAVPEATPPATDVSRQVQLAHDDVVELTVTSPRAGAVGVHGLSKIEPVREGQSVTIRFRAIYTGRFPLHFHGTDGSHFEILDLQILPGQRPAQQASR